MNVEAERRPWLALGATLSAQMLASMGMATAPVLAPAVAPQLGLPIERVGLYMGLMYAVAMGAGLFSGGWVARFGASRLLLGVLGSIALAALVASAAPPVMLLLAAAALVGVGYGTSNPAAADILGRHAPVGSPGLFFSLKQTGVPIGVAGAGALMPWGLASIGWRASTWGLAAGCVALGLLLLPAITRLEAGRPPPRPAPGWWPSLRMALMQPGLRSLSLVSLAYATTQQGFLTFVVAYLVLERGLPLAVAAALLSASQLACVGMRIAMGHVADRWMAPRRLLGVLGLCSAASCLGLSLLPQGVGVPWAALVVVAAGASTMGWNGVYFAQLVRTVPREELAAAAGATQFFTFAGAMMGPLLFAGAVHAGVSHAVAYVGMALVAAVAALAMLRPEVLQRRAVPGAE